jgi:hypothetical protein
MMSELEPAKKSGTEKDKEDQPSSGPNLTLLYSIIVLALLAAMGFAALIVLPFYRRR